MAETEIKEAKAEIVDHNRPQEFYLWFYKTEDGRIWWNGLYESEKDALGCPLSGTEPRLLLKIKVDPKDFKKPE